MRPLVFIMRASQNIRVNTLWFFVMTRALTYTVECLATANVNYLINLCAKEKIIYW